MFFLQSQAPSARTSMSTKGVSTSAGSQGPRKRPPVLRWDAGVSSNFAVRARYEAGPPAAAPGVVEGSVEDVWWLPLDDMINIVVVSILPKR